MPSGAIEERTEPDSHAPAGGKKKNKKIKKIKIKNSTALTSPVGALADLLSQLDLVRIDF